MATWLDDFLTAIKRLKRSGTLLPARNYLDIGSGLNVQPDPDDADTYTLTATGTPAWPGTSAELLAGDGSIVSVGHNLTLANGVLSASTAAAPSFPATRSGGVSVGSVVRIAAYSHNKPVVSLANNQTAMFMPAVGIVSSVYESQCIVQTGGVVNGLSDLSAGTTYYAGANGGLLELGAIVDTAGTRYVQAIGVATGPSSLTISINPLIFALVD